MTKAKDSLSSGTHAINVLARLAAKKQVQEELRERGVRVSLVKPAEIAAQTERYLAHHPEVYLKAVDRALQMGLISAGWGELEQAIYQLVRSKYGPVYETETTKIGIEKTQEISAVKG
jgi:hypothetical protein